MLKIIIASLLFINLNPFFAIEITWESNCQTKTCLKQINGHEKESTKSITFKSNIFERPKCFENKNCWLFLGSIHDSLKVSINNHPLTDFSNQNAEHIYVKHNSLAIPIPNNLFNDHNFIEIQTFDLNQGLIGVTDNILIDDYLKIHRLTNSHWIKTTGSSLFSSYSLFIFSILFLILYFILLNEILINLFVYCLITSVYLLSFSEVPREYLNPLLVSGPIHFSIRLFQDLLLIRLFFSLFKFKNTYSLIIQIFYILSISFLIICMISGVSNYNFYLKSMYIFAPLVALPMITGFLLSFKIEDKKERKILIPIAFLLMIFQVNDLFVFWRLIEGYFFVKWYPPIVIILLITIFLRREILTFSKLKTMEEIFKITSSVAHDLQAPISALNSLADSRTIKNEEEFNVFKISLNRLKEISQNILSHRKNGIKVINPFELNFLIREIITEKEISYKTSIFFKSSIKQILITSISKDDLARVLSNFINNAIEASIDLNKIEIETYLDGNNVIITIKDFAKGIPKEVLKKLGKVEITFNKPSGNGLGVLSSISLIKNAGGDVEIYSKINLGTTIKILIPI